MTFKCAMCGKVLGDVELAKTGGMFETASGWAYLCAEHQKHESRLAERNKPRRKSEPGNG